MLLHLHVFDLQESPPGQVENGGREGAGRRNFSFPEKRFHEGGRQVGRRLVDIRGNVVETIVPAVAAPGRNEERQPAKRDDDKPGQPEDDPASRPGRPLRRLGQLLLLADDRLADEALLLGPDRSQRPGPGKDAVRELRRPEKADFQELPGVDAGSPETGGPGVHDLGDARKRAVAVDEEILLIRSRRRQAHRDHGGIRPLVPTVADGFPIQFADVGVTDDPPRDAIMNMECAPLIGGQEVPLGLDAVGRPVQFDPQRPAAFVRDGDVVHARFPRAVRTVQERGQPERGPSEAAAELEGAVFIDRESPVGGNGNVDPDFEKVEVLHGRSGAGRARAHHQDGQDGRPQNAAPERRFDKSAHDPFLYHIRP